MSLTVFVVLENIQKKTEYNISFLLCEVFMLKVITLRWIIVSSGTLFGVCKFLNSIKKTYNIKKLFVEYCLLLI